MGHIISRSYRPYKIRREVQEDPLILKYLIMLDPATEWFEIVQYNDKYSATISNLVEQAWLYIYSLLTMVEYDCGR